MISQSIQQMKGCLLLFPAILAASLLPFIAAQATELQFETDTTLKASSLLPKEYLNSTLFQIQDEVKNDGFINTYTVTTPEGTRQIESNISLYKFLLETEAISAMKEVQQSDVFIKSFKESGAATVEGVKQLFTDPEETLKSAGSGISSLFSRANESIFNSSPGETEDNTLEQASGFSNAKRSIAYTYKVDVYSSNKALQENLERLAWAEYSGGITLSVATMPIGGVAGLTLTVSGTARLLGEVIATTPPAELKLQNRGKLEKMGIESGLTDLFIENPWFSPLQQTAFVMALEKIPATVDKALPLQVALQTSDLAMAKFLTTMMLMQAGYNGKIAPLTQFKTVARFFCSVDTNNKLIIILPADYISLNKRLVAGLQAMKDPKFSGYELWTLGAVSPKAQQYAKQAGWKVKQTVAKKLGLKERHQDK